MRAISRLETKTYNSQGCSGSQRHRAAWGSASSSNSSPVCAICLEEFQDGQVQGEKSKEYILWVNVIVFISCLHWNLPLSLFYLSIWGSSRVLMSFTRTVSTPGCCNTAPVPSACTTSWVRKSTFPRLINKVTIKLMEFNNLQSISKIFFSLFLLI